MKRLGIVLITLIATAIITFVFFEIMSWYHFGDIPTRVVLVRLIAFYCAVSGIAISTIALLTRKKDKNGNK